MGHPANCRRHPAGVTLIELLVALAIVAILGALAYPSFMQSIFKGRRADGLSALTRAQQAQERFRSNNVSYAAALTDLGLAATSPDQHYTLTLSGVTPNGYQITATAQGAQAHDTRCKFLQVSMNAQGAVVYSASADGVTFSSTGNTCWAR